MGPRVARAALLIVVVGCSSEPRGGPRLETTPLSGTVLLDGEPKAGVLVEFHPEADTTEMKRLAMVNTNENGEFAASTYEEGDGLPPGTYHLTFKWIGPGRKDRLNGAYADPKKSQHEVALVAGEPNDLGVIELSTKGSGK